MSLDLIKISFAYQCFWAFCTLPTIYLLACFVACSSLGMHVTFCVGWSPKVGGILKITEHRKPKGHRSRSSLDQQCILRLYPPCLMCFTHCKAWGEGYHEQTYVDHEVYVPRGWFLHLLLLKSRQDLTPTSRCRTLCTIKEC
jgi:hypothetical protein